jgi:predicted type IV restriction endonuclease
MSVRDFIITLQGRPKDELWGLSEANSRRWIIEPILQELGWNTDRWSNYREMIEEYPIGERRVDYCLQIGGANKVFIEAKKPDVFLDNHQIQLFGYVQNGDAELALLTNCIEWWFYLPSAEGPWQKRPFSMLNLLDEDAGSVAGSLSSYLSKDRIRSRTAFDGAATAIEEQQRAALVDEALPRAWKRMIFDEDDRLVEVLSDLVEGAEGQRPAHSDVLEFIASRRKLYEPVEARDEKKRAKRPPRKNQSRHMPANEARRETKEFSKRIIDEVFSGAFSVVRPFQVMFGSSDDLVWFGGYNKLSDDWWYRLGEKHWAVLRNDPRTSTICLTNAAEGAVYVIPLEDVEQQVRMRQWDRSHLEINIDFVSHRWRDLDWGIRQYFRRFD